MAQFHPPFKEMVTKAKSAGCGPTIIDTSTATISRGTYKRWNEDKMVRAVETVLKKKTCIRKAGEMYGIPNQ